MWIIDKLFNRKIEGESSADALLEHVVQNEETNTTEIGGNVEVDGDVQVNSSIVVNGTAQLSEINIEGFSKIIDNDGRQIGKDLEDAVSGNNEMTITFTEDDYDEDEGIYVKHVEVNNVFIEIDTGNLSPDSTIRIYNPYFKAINPTGILTGGTFNGLLYQPQNRYFEITLTELTNHFLCIFNGYLSDCYFEY